MTNAFLKNDRVMKGHISNEFLVFMLFIRQTDQNSQPVMLDRQEGWIDFFYQVLIANEVVTEVILLEP